MARIAFIFVFLCIVSISLAKKFTQCELVYELRRQGFPEYLMKDLVCLIEGSSSFKTNVIGGPDSDGSYNHGLFQINDRYWCNDGPWPGKICNERCSDLLSENITRSSNCAKTIMNMRGLSPWVSWVDNYQRRTLPELYC